MTQLEDVYYTFGMSTLPELGLRMTAAIKVVRMHNSGTRIFSVRQLRVEQKARSVLATGTSERRQHRTRHSLGSPPSEIRPYNLIEASSPTAVDRRHARSP